MVYIGLCNPKSPTNVGAVMRAAGCYSANAVYYTGDRFDRAAKFHTDTKDAHSSIGLNRVDSLCEGMTAKQKPYEVVCVEFVVGATPLPEFKHPENAMYIFGPEDSSIEQAIIDKADHVVYMPTKGCMNLAASVNVLLYDRLSKSNKDTILDHMANDELIKRSRDVNNRLEIKLD